MILGGKADALRHDLPELPELDNLFAPEVWGCSILTRAKWLGGLEASNRQRGKGAWREGFQSFPISMLQKHRPCLLYSGACLFFNDLLLYIFFVTLALGFVCFLSL